MKRFLWTSLLSGPRSHRNDRRHSSSGPGVERARAELAETASPWVERCAGGTRCLGDSSSVRRTAAERHRLPGEQMVD